MSLIIYTSTINAPGILQPPAPRYEIGKFFVTIYHVARVVKYGDQRFVDETAAKLKGCLGKLRPMFVNQYHPSSPAKNSEGSIYTGTTDEIHEGAPRLPHYHIELFGNQRDDGFTEEEITTLKNKLASVDWG